MGLSHKGPQPEYVIAILYSRISAASMQGDWAVQNVFGSKLYSGRVFHEHRFSQQNSKVSNQISFGFPIPPTSKLRVSCGPLSFQWTYWRIGVASLKYADVREKSLSPSCRCTTVSESSTQFAQINNLILEINVKILDYGSFDYRF